MATIVNTKPAPQYVKTELQTNWVNAIGRETTRFGLVLVLLWIGGMKFTSYEAEGIRPFVENSPAFAWTYPVFGVQGFSNFLGVTEILIGAMIAARYLSPKVAALGGFLASGMFLSTLSFLVTTPAAWESTLGGFPAASIVGQFLLKDLVLVGASIWSVGDSWAAVGVHNES